MRTERLLVSFYHFVPRVADRRMALEPKDEEIFRKILRSQEVFSGVSAITY